MKAPYDIFDYPFYWRGREYEDQAEKLAIKKFLTKIKKRGKLVDIAGGFGRLSYPLASYFERIVLVDHSEKLLEEARQYLVQFKNIKFKKGDCQKLPVKDKTFDLALMVRIVHHLEDPEKTLVEAARVLKPGGFLILEFANKLHFLALIKALLSGDFGYPCNLSPVERRSKKTVRQKTIAFCNHHPQAIQKTLTKVGFRVIDKLSVSNCRSPFLKKIIPFHLLLSFESLIQRPAAKINFGPSIFLLAQKQPKNPQA